MEDCPLVQVLGGNDLGNDLVHEVLAQFLERDVIRVLDGDDDGVYALGDAHALLHPVFACHLHDAKTQVSMDGKGKLLNTPSLQRFFNIPRTHSNIYRLDFSGKHYGVLQLLHRNIHY